MFAIIGKWNNRVQSISESSLDILGTANVYQVETSYTFPDPLVADIFEYVNNDFVDRTPTTLQNIDSNWRSNFPDYKAARVAMYIAMLTVGGFENLSLADKEIASRWFIVGRLERNSVHTTEQQIVNGLIYHESSVEARKHRFNACITEVYNRLDDDQIKEVMIAMDFSKTVYAYIDLGQEGTLEGNPEGLFDYIEARSGTSWVTTGLKAQNYVPVGYENCIELSVRLMQILRDGLY